MWESVKRFVKKETVFCIAACCAVLTMFWIPPDIEYVHYIDFRVLCLLFCLMAVVAGFKFVGAFEWMTYQLLRRIHSRRVLAVTLVLLPFFSSMLVTNDVALLVFVPFTLGLLVQLRCCRHIVPILVLQTVAANLGSMATPVGNPQNLYLYSYYSLSAGEFFAVTLPLTAVSFLLLVGVSYFCLPKTLPERNFDRAEITNGKELMVYGALFFVCLLTVFRIVPYQIVTIVVFTVIIFTNKELLRDVDGMLLATFVCFFVISENLGRIDSIRIFLQQLLGRNTLLTAVGASQVISNVPAAVLLSGFTDRWRDLLAGVNIGGLGTPIASLASLITLKLYLCWPNAKIGRFLGVFTFVNIAGLVILLLFYFVM